MNRREAVAALVALPSVAHIAKVSDLKPNDVIVVECDEVLDVSLMTRIHGHVQQIWPGRQVVVLDKGMRIKVIPGEPLA